MRAVHPGPVIGLIGELALLATLAATVGLSGAGWIVGVACAVVTNALLARALARRADGGLGPADRVTLIRATLVGGVAALVADSFGRHMPVSVLVALAGIALVLDAVDGWVARRTGTSSPLGARFDLEVDAFLILVLSGYVARSAGAWVLAIGAARYAFVAAGWVLPWLRGSVPPRYWCKVVAAIQGVVLTFAAADIGPHLVRETALALSLVLLAESFGRELWWLRRHRSDRVAPADPSRVRIAATRVTTVLAGLLVWFALVAPDETSRLTPAAFIRIPLEAILLVAVVLVLPKRGRAAAAVSVGVLLGVLTILRILDMGFFAALGRPFNPVVDWSYFGPAEGLLSDSIGRRDAIISLVGVVVVLVALLVLVPMSVLRLTRLVDRHRRTSIRAGTALGAVWVLCAVLGVQIVRGAPIASTSAFSLAVNRIGQVHADIRDEQTFAKGAAVDPIAATPGSGLLTALRGKDVIVAFVESYGRVAIQDSTFAPGVDAVLDAGTNQLRAAGFSSRSAFLTSPTFGGVSWLAHSTLQSGLWIDNQLRYNDLVGGDRFTLSDAFKRAGWRTVADVPSNEQDWSQGTSFYHYDKIYDAHNVGYAGPKFSYATMPDQYILAAFQRQELAKPNHTPVMAEIDLVSSHTPWAPLPHLVPWNAVGDGSVFDAMPAQGQSPAAVWRDPALVQAAYGQSIQYSLSTLTSFVQTFHDDNLVLVVLGDHQPATIVSGGPDTAGHDVPITIIAHDPTVLDRMSGWGWQDGLRPSPNAPVWPMDAFRNRFLTAFGPHPSR